MDTAVATSVRRIAGDPRKTHSFSGHNRGSIERIPGHSPRLSVWRSEGVYVGPLVRERRNRVRKDGCGHGGIGKPIVRGIGIIVALEVYGVLCGYGEAAGNVPWAIPKVE